MKNTVFLVALAILAWCVTPRAARADVITLTLAGSGYDGTLEITTDSTPVSNPYPCAGCNSGPGYIATGISGTINNVSISGLIPANGYLDNDNIVYLTAPFLDNGGLSFIANAIDYGVGESLSQPSIYLMCSGSQSGCGGIYPVSLTANAVPEPATWAILLVSVWGVGLIVRRSTLRTQRSIDR